MKINYKKFKYLIYQIYFFDDTTLKSKLKKKVVLFIFNVSTNK